MAPTPTAAREAFTQNAARTVPITYTAPPTPYLNIRDKFRLALFFLIPVYARIYLPCSAEALLEHAYSVGFMGIGIIHFFEGDVSAAVIWDVVYGLLVASFPKWAPPILPISMVEGWRWEVVYWMFVARQLTYFLPKRYGSDIKVWHCWRLFHVF
jgi:hypothetical protein